MNNLEKHNVYCKPSIYNPYRHDFVDNPSRIALTAFFGQIQLSSRAAVPVIVEWFIFKWISKKIKEILKQFIWLLP